MLLIASMMLIVFMRASDSVSSIRVRISVLFLYTVALGVDGAEGMLFTFPNE